MSYPGPEEIQTYARKSLQNMLVFAQDRFDFPTLSCNLVFVDSRSASHQASRSMSDTKQPVGYQIKINTFYPARFDVRGFREYKSYDSDLKIGNFKTSDWKVWIDAVVAHELSHIIEMTFIYDGYCHSWKLGNNNFKYLGQAGIRNHGEFFKRVYRILRDEFVNHRHAGCGIDGSDFDVNDLEERISAMPACSYTGILVTIGGREFEVAGFNPNTKRKLFRYQVREVKTGELFAAKLSTIINCSPSATTLMQDNQVLLTEYEAHMELIGKLKSTKSNTSDAQSQHKLQG